MQACKANKAPAGIDWMSDFDVKDIHYYSESIQRAHEDTRIPNFHFTQMVLWNVTMSFIEICGKF